MTRDEANDLVNGALNRLVRDDLDLFELRLCERALQFKIAHYMAQSHLIQAPLTVDCEYNRHHADEKRLELFGTGRRTKVFPDILVHQRNSDANNLIVLEIKRVGQRLARDQETLRAFSVQLHYAHAGQVIVGRRRNGLLVAEVRWVNM